MKITTRLVAAGLVAGTLAAVAGCGGGASTAAKSSGPLRGAHFVVGSKDFTESILLGKMTALLLEHAGATVDDKTNIKGSVNTRNAMTSGNIDMYWEYTGSAWLVYLKHDKPITDSQRQYQAVKTEDAAKNHVVWLKPTPMSDTYAFAVSRSVARKLNITTDSDLARLPQSEQTFCLESEFSTRPDGWPGFEKAYGIRPPKSNVKLLDIGVIYSTTSKGGTCNFGEVFSTDGRIPALKLTVLKDDKHFFPNYNAALTMMKKTYDRNPQVAKVIQPLSDKINDRVMAQLNARVDVQGDSADTVAKDWLTQQGLLR